MPYNNNFESLTMHDGVLDVKGIAEPTPVGAQLVSRHVAVRQQNGGVATTVPGPASLGQDWITLPALPANGFHAGDALAIGIDTYFVTEPTETFLTVTWSQIVAIEPGP